MSEKRKRGQNFAIEEKDRLVKLLCSHKDTILNKKTDGSTNEAKSKAWIDVTNAFNAVATVYRSRDSLMKVWEKLKTESKLYYQSSRQSITGTGGGPSEVKVDPLLEQVCTLLGRACTGIVGVQDCDAISFMEVPPKKFLPNTESTAIVEKSVSIAQETAEINVSLFNDTDHDEPSKQETSHENLPIIKTPLWSRRRPQLSQTNERTEAVTSLCTSYKNINKKKEDIEEIKIQLLQDEINYKRKLNQLHLEAAMKDVEIKTLHLEATRKELEIKTEVLNQLRGGTINMGYLFNQPRNKEI